jgi:glyoxylase-like metal-dependent hydrolase (beta-lactamase superfamily II)
LQIEVIHTPGHSPGGVCYLIEKEHVMISGDTLFKGSIGRLDFPSSDAEKMWSSLERLSRLAPETKVFPGHGESTTLARENWLKNAKNIFGG